MSIKQPSDKQRAASRTNGAKSKGPVSAEGRARSSQNSLRHGLSSPAHTQLAVENMVLPHEDRAQFEALRKSYFADFQPANQSQQDLVETMAAARWRLTRLQHVETKLLEKEMVLRAKEMSKELTEMTEVEKLAWVFDRSANQDKSLTTLIRYEGNLNRTYGRAFKQLQELQSQAAQACDCESEEIPNEPEPPPSAPPATPKTTSKSQESTPIRTQPSPEPPQSPRPTPPQPQIPAPKPATEPDIAID
ncbi:MAG TPA: hypothetical protein VN841_11410 [Bryobacteraceae bacterium]|nr:hypothetical protein [Bryobacteraceae bacterium]